MVLPLGVCGIQMAPIGLPGQGRVKPLWGCAKGMQLTPLSLPYSQAAGRAAACVSKQSALGFASLPLQQLGGYGLDVQLVRQD